MQDFIDMLYDPVRSKDVFLLLDMDGTLLDTDRVHYNAYKQILQEKFGIELSLYEFEKIINESNLQTYMIDQLGMSETKMNQIVNMKRDLLFSDCFEINFIKGMDELIEVIHQNNINYAVATNTNRKTIEYFQQRVPLLKTLKNWITREDYIHPKPNRECYDIALQKFSKKEKYIVGFENSINGYLALKNITTNIFIVNDKNCFSYKFFQAQPVTIISGWNL